MMTVGGNNGRMSLIFFSRLETSKTLVWLMTFQHSIWPDSAIFSHRSYSISNGFSLQTWQLASLCVNFPARDARGSFFFYKLYWESQSFCGGSEMEKGESGGKKGFKAPISRDGCCFCSMGGSWVQGQARQNNRPLHHNSVSTDPHPHPSSSSQWIILSAQPWGETFRVTLADLVYAFQ